MPGQIATARTPMLEKGYQGLCKWMVAWNKPTEHESHSGDNPIRMHGLLFFMPQRHFVGLILNFYLRNYYIEILDIIVSVRVLFLWYKIQCFCVK